ncbi:hypothetical protein [uncultured Paludibaculum sp.]|uniref:hypothetical protein n=1 Tax=uncultured Paludibaculum sp. TaxID=1765020 RepID=UPI002AAAECFE|nr:hypothetical protein [uncultured Paludibaculum sp.]
MSRRTKSKSKTKTADNQPKGYDFGGEHFAVYVGSLSFIESLKAADVVGCAYGIAYSDDLRGEVAAVSLVGKNERALSDAFKEFEDWSTGSGTQAVDLTFIFLTKGGYLVGIGPRVEALTRRFNAAASPLSPIVMSPSWIKSFETRQPPVEDLRSYCERNLVAPFLFHGCVLPSSQDIVRSTPDSLRPIGPRPQLIFRATFADEERVKRDDGSPAAVILAVHGASQNQNSGSRERPKMPQQKLSPEDFRRRRSDVLEMNFPVTLERLRHFGDHSDVITTIETAGIHRWQIEQAICNLTLSFSSCNGILHYTAVRNGHLVRHVTEALTDRFEEANGMDPLDRHLDERSLRLQIALDAAALLNQSGHTSSESDPVRLQHLLAKFGFLENS